MGWMAAHRVTGDTLTTDTNRRLLADQILADGGEPDAWDFEMTPVHRAMNDNTYLLDAKAAARYGSQVWNPWEGHPQRRRIRPQLTTRNNLT